MSDLPFAWTRAVTDSFVHCLSMTPHPPIDLARAREQHAAYRAALAAAGFTVELLPGDERHPDGCFLEDVGVILDSVLVIARPGAPSRRDETSVLDAVRHRFESVARIEPPGTLDGGDVLRVGNRLFVGRSARTNGSGSAQLAAVARRIGLETIEVPLRGALHLESVATALGREAVLLAKGFIDERVFRGCRVLFAADGEEFAANVLWCPGSAGARRVLVPAAATATAGVLAAAGFEPTKVENEEFAKGDGGLTCLSLRAR